MAALGNALKNNINKRHVVQKIKNCDISSRNRKIDTFASDPNKKKTPIESQCEVNTIDDFLSSLSKRTDDFADQHEGDEICIIDSLETSKPKQKCQSVLDFGEIEEKLEEENKKLKIVRRPVWNENMSPEELSLLEEDHFIAWKKQLALNFQKTNLTITPFEKNIEIWRQLWRVVEKSDLLVQIVDARNPLLFWSCDLFSYFKQTKKSENVMLLINKSDFLTENQRWYWKRHFDNLGVKFAFFSAKEVSTTSGISVSNKQGHIPFKSNSTEVITPEQLLKTFDHLASTQCYENKTKEKEKRFVVGMVGYPNVGKSSVINRLFGAKKVRVGEMPGKTKHLQTLNISESVQLCDCPGLVFPTLLNSRAELICSGIISVDHSKNLIDSVALICSRVPLFLFIRLYKGVLFPVNRLFVDHMVLLKSLARQRKWLTACQVPNIIVAARIVIKDYINGDLLFCFPPPGMAEEEKLSFLGFSHEDSNIVLGNQTSALAQSKDDQSMREFEKTLKKDDLLPETKLYDNKLGSSKKKHLKKARGIRAESRKEELKEMQRVKMINRFF